MKYTPTIILLLFSLQLQAQHYSKYKKEEYIQNGDTLNYRLLEPKKVKKNKTYPLVLFLHGAGERGLNNESQLRHGGKLFLEKKNRRKFPAYVLFPQCPPEIMWTHRQKHKTEEEGWIFNFPLEDGPTWPAALVNNLVDSLKQSPHIDIDRIYIMGISMGGIGALEFLYRWPHKYAAAAVICGGHDPKLAEEYCHVPVWFFHGGKDDVVPIWYSQPVYEKLKECNAQTKFTLYPEANHNSWDPALAEPRLLKWLLKKEK